MFTIDFVKELLKTHHEITVNGVVPVSYSLNRLLKDMDRKKLCFFGQLTVNQSMMHQYLTKSAETPDNICTMFKGMMQMCIKSVYSSGTTNQHVQTYHNHLFDDIYVFSDTFFQGSDLTSPNITDGSPASQKWSLRIGKDTAANTPVEQPIMHFVGYKISY